MYLHQTTFGCSLCIYRVQNVFLLCPTPRLHCFLSSHWPSFRFLSFMAFFIPSIQFFFGIPRVFFCFGIHFNGIFGCSHTEKLDGRCIWYVRVRWEINYMPGYWWKNPKETDHFDSLGIDGSIILKLDPK